MTEHPHTPQEPRPQEPRPQEPRPQDTSAEETRPLTAGAPAGPAPVAAPAPFPEPEPAGARHPVEIGYLVMGVAFLGLAGIWVLIAGDAVEGGDVRWLLPLPWVVAGLAGLGALVSRDRRRRRI